jgi:NAD(P)H-dependent FMN reductase
VTQASTPPKIAIILGSTRPGRKGADVAKWVYDLASKRDDATFELIDLLDYPLPHLDEAVPPAYGQYANDHTKEWAAKIAQYDGYVFVTPEYNRSTSGVLKNAIDFLYAEWNNKAASFVSYGATASGVRAVEHLRTMMAELQIADVRTQVSLSFAHDWVNYTELAPQANHEGNLETQLDQLISWSKAMRTVRTGA